MARTSVTLPTKFRALGGNVGGAIDATWEPPKPGPVLCPTAIGSIRSAIVAPPK